MDAQMSWITAAIQRLFFAGNTELTSPSSTVVSPALDSQVLGLEPETALLESLSQDQVKELFYQVGLGQAELHQELVSSDKKLLVKLSKELGDDSQLNQYAPRLPRVVPQLLRSLRDPSSSAQQQAEIISQDPVIAASILRVANSSKFSYNRPKINSFQRALVTLGNNEVRALLSTVSMQPIMEVSSESYTDFGALIWQNALSAAVCAKSLSAQHGVDPFQAYMAGLIHNIGASTIFLRLINQADNNAPAPSLIFQTIEQLAATISTKLARLWEFDQDIIQALTELEQGSTDKSQLGKLLELSQNLSQGYSLWQHDLLSQEQVNALLFEYRQPKNRFEQLNKLLAD
ncbi:MAG: hypothetical protein COA90_10520 [Gammaproteobacteria bacterium]|nr:MAG: hypothetical protein COA90_10520 [Gammaproteobacteria bacterium]